jgi:hypothetical protein
MVGRHLRVGLRRGGGRDRHGFSPTTAIAEGGWAGHFGHGVSCHDPKRPGDLLDMGAVALANGESCRHGGRGVLGGGLPFRPRRRHPSRRDRRVSPSGSCRLAHPLLHRQSADSTSGRNHCFGTCYARSSWGAAMMAMVEPVSTYKLVLLAGTFALLLSVVGCGASGAATPLSSHGAARGPTFGMEGGGG